MNCKYYDKDTGWCKLHVDWSNPMPIVAYCPKSPCVNYEEPKPTYEELYEHWLKTKDRPKRKRKNEPLPDQLDLFDVIDKA